MEKLCKPLVFPEKLCYTQPVADGKTGGSGICRIRRGGEHPQTGLHKEKEGLDGSKWTQLQGFWQAVCGAKQCRAAHWRGKGRLSGNPAGAVAHFFLFHAAGRRGPAAEGRWTALARTEVTQVVRPRCQRVADQLGFELVDVCLDRENTGKYLRIYIDKPGGMDLDGCEKYHRAIQPLVEDYDYDFLEVSSPGADRPLKTDSDLERSLGENVELRLFRAADGAKEWHGALAGYDRENVTIVTGGAEKAFPRKACALIRLDVDLSEISETVIGEETGED